MRGFLSVQRGNGVILSCSLEAVHHLHFLVSSQALADLVASMVVAVLTAARTEGMSPHERR